VYWVQVGAYRSAGAASRVAALVKGEILVAASYADQPLLRVRVGPFMDRGRAAVRLHELEAKGWRAFIAEGR
jgi:cell division protein FtsN